MTVIQWVDEDYVPKEGEILTHRRDYYQPEITLHVLQSYIGATLADREENHYHDSDFYAVVWDEEEQHIKSVYYGTTSFPSPRSAVVDATPEVLAKATNWLEGWYYSGLVEENKQQAEAIAVGKKLRYVKGRKLPHGTVGWCVDIQHKTYRYNVTSVIVTFDEVLSNAEGTVSRQDRHWQLYGENFVVVNPEQYLRSEDDLRKIAKRLASRQQFYAPFVGGGMLCL